MDLENRKNSKQLKVREDRDQKGLKNWFHLACPVSTMGARNRGYCVGSVQLPGAVAGQAPQFMKGSEGKTFKQLDRVQQFPPPHRPNTETNPVSLFTGSVDSGLKPGKKETKDTPFVCSAFSFFPSDFLG